MLKHSLHNPILLWALVLCTHDTVIPTVQPNLSFLPYIQAISQCVFDYFLQILKFLRVSETNLGPSLPMQMAAQNSKNTMMHNMY